MQRKTMMGDETSNDQNLTNVLVEGCFRRGTCLQDAFVSWTHMAEAC